MGACASTPKDLDTSRAPAPVEAPSSLKPEAETTPQENNGGETETKKEEPLVDLSEPVAPKAEEVATPAAVESAKPVVTVEAAKPTDEKKVEAVEEVNNFETPRATAAKPVVTEEAAKPNEEKKVETVEEVNNFETPIAEQTKETSEVVKA